MSEPVSELIAKRYLPLEELGRGGMGVVYRARDRLQHETVALKLVRVPDEPDPGTATPVDREGSSTFATAASGPRFVAAESDVSPDSTTESFVRWSDPAFSGSSPSSQPGTIATETETVTLAAVGEPTQEASRSDLFRLALAREFQVLSAIRHPKIISVLDYGFDRRRSPYFTMELIDSPVTLYQVTRERPLVGRLELLVQLLQALTYLHRRRIIHHDLKPGNILVQDGQVKVLDFGLAEFSRESRRQDTVSGTIPYLAPELLLGGAATESSDLYSVGVMLYELCTDRHPFASSDRQTLITRILQVEPDLSAAGIPTSLAPMLGRLLAKTPEERYGHASEVIRDLCTAEQLEPPEETLEIRESFLQAATLVGREAETGHLTAALNRALSGRGSGILLAGESGVGKSRLLDEIRNLALVEGALVLTGQAVDSARRTYGLWREVARWLCLIGDPDDLEAGVLAPLVPDIELLLDRRVPPAPRLDPQSTQTRLMQVFESLLRRCEQPLLLILDDVHWASAESLELLNRILRGVEEMPLLVIAAYRDDEAHTFESSLPDLEVVRLARLTEEQIAELSVSMLGRGGVDERLLELLRRETEGNVFFLIEVVRALAEDVGRLDRVGTAPLPEKVFTGGIQRIIRRRLERAPAWAAEALEIAAVAGRRLDLDVLAKVDPELDLDRFVRACADVAILEIHAQEWRFAHDKLREGLLAGLSPERRRVLHERIAGGIEEAYGDAPEQAGALAYHWSRSTRQGRSDLTEKALHHLERAAGLALAGFANEETVRLLSDATSLAAGRATPWVEDGVTAEPVAVPAYRRALWERQLGEASRSLLRLDDSRRHLEQAIALLGRPVPGGRPALGLAILREAWRQFRTRRRAAAGRAPAPARPEEEDAVLERARSHNLLAEVYWFTLEPIRLVHSALSALNDAERASLSPTLPPAYAALSVVTGMSQLHAMANRYAGQALDSARQLDDPPTTAVVLGRVSLYYVGVGDWSELEARAGEGVEITRRIGNEGALGDFLTELANGAYYQGRYDRSLELWRELEEVARNLPHFQVQVLNGNAAVGLRRGRAKAAADLLERAEQSLTEQADVTKRIITQGLRALAALRLGDRKSARELADATAELIAGATSLNFTAIDAHAAVVEVYAELWGAAVEDSSPTASACRNLAWRSWGGLSRFSRTFPIGRPQAKLWRARLLELDGRSRKAERGWRAALADADRLGMPFESALAHLGLGRRLPGAQGRRHLETASVLFERLGARDRLEQARGAMQGMSQ